MIVFHIFFFSCFTTTFLRAHSWLNWVDEDDDEDEVGLREKPEDTRVFHDIKNVELMISEIELTISEIVFKISLITIIYRYLKLYL